MADVEDVVVGTGELVRELVAERVPLRVCDGGTDSAGVNEAEPEADEDDEEEDDLVADAVAAAELHKGGTRRQCTCRSHTK